MSLNNKFNTSRHYEACRKCKRCFVFYFLGIATGLAGINGYIDRTTYISLINKYYIKMSVALLQIRRQGCL